MTVLIRGMEMPVSCKECPLSDKEAWCLIPGNWRERYYMPKSGRSEHCPLAEVPTPHGRLIDADEFFEKIPPGDIEHDEKISRTGAIADVCTWVLSAPTIIEAENEADISD